MTPITWLLKSADIRLGSCSREFQIRTRWALSIGISRFSLALSMCFEVRKDWLNITICIVKLSGIPSGTCSRCSICVSSTTQWALFNGVIRCSIVQTIVVKIWNYWYFATETRSPIKEKYYRFTQADVPSVVFLFEVELDELYWRMLSEFL